MNVDTSKRRRLGMSIIHSTSDTHTSSLPPAPVAVITNNHHTKRYNWLIVAWMNGGERWEGPTFRMHTHFCIYHSYSYIVRTNTMLLMCYRQPRRSCRPIYYTHKSRKYVYTSYIYINMKRRYMRNDDEVSGVLLLLFFFFVCCASSSSSFQLFPPEPKRFSFK